MTFRAHSEDHDIYVEFTGLTSDSEIQEFARMGQSDTRYTDLHYVLNDFTGCSGVTFSEAVTLEFAAIDSAARISNPRLRMAVVTERDDVKALVSAYLNTQVSGFALKTFPSVALASVWLGRSVPNKR